MSIRPIDYQVLIPKSQEFSKENQVLNEKNRFEHQQLVQQEQRDMQLKLQKVNKFENKDEPKIKDDHERKQGNYSKREQNKETKNKEKQSCKQIKQLGNKIDLKI